MKPNRKRRSNLGTDMKDTEMKDRFVELRVRMLPFRVEQDDDTTERAGIV